MTDKPQKKKTRGRPSKPAPGTPAWLKAQGELPDITDKQEAFVHGLLQGKTASDAYRAAYNCENMADTTIWAHASRLKSDGKVATWLQRSRILALDTHKMGLEEYLAGCQRIAEAALENKQTGAAATAHGLMAKALGFDQVTVNVRDNRASDALRIIQDQLGPEIAQQFAGALGIELEADETRH